MAISRMNMERQMRNMGGIMGLEEPRQGYFLGKIVRKAKKAVKKVVKSPIGKAAIMGAIGFGIPGTQFGGLFGRASLGGAAKGLFGTQGISPFATKYFGTGTKLQSIGDLFRVGGKAGADVSALRLLGGAAGLGAIAAPFFLGGDEEEIDEGTPFTDPQESIENIRDQARAYYSDPTRSALYFMPPKAAVKFGGAFAEGGLADIPREGYDNGGDVMMASNMENDAILQNLYEKFLDLGMSPKDAEEAARKLFEKMSQQQMNTPRTSAAKGGLMDLGGMEKDYREGGFVPIGAEERADDVPARLSKNEFVFTAEAVRNAGGGDIDKGAEVMQNMMDNLEAGGMISEESQGKENPAQAMFDQAQMLEGRLA